MLMIPKLLVLCTMVCSVFAGGAPDLATAKTESAIDPLVTEVSNVVFRHRPDLIPKMLEFQKQYPEEFELIDYGYFDRGFCDPRDKCFLLALATVATLVDTGQCRLVGDFGCGRGDTSYLFGSTGAKVIGIERYMQLGEYEKSKKLLDQYETLAEKLGVPFDVKMKVSTDARLLDEDTEILADSFSVLFMGKFLHMLNPDDAKKLISRQAHRMLERNGYVFASVDGVASMNGSAEAYLKAVAAGKKFPSVMTMSQYGKLSAKGEVVELDQTPLFRHAADAAADAIDKAGGTVFKCRELNARKWYYCGPNLKSTQKITSETPIKRTPWYASLDRTVCFFDSNLIDFVFPRVAWVVHVERVGF